jgi:replicative DNA helicase
VIRLTAEIQEKAYNRQDISAEIKELMELGQHQESSVEVINMLDLLEVPLMEFIENREYIPTGIEGLDDRIRGTEPGQLIVIAAQPGGGKTSLAFQIISKSPDGLFISLEESRDNLFTKLLAMESDVNLNNFKYGKFSESQLQDIAEAKVRIKGYFSSTVMIGNLDLLHIVMAVKKHVRNTKCRAVAIENVGLIVGGKGKDLTEQYNYIARTLKLLAKELNVTIYLLSQQNKASYNGEPTKADLNYLTANDPDFLWYCWDDSIIIAKGRTTMTGRIPNILFRAEVSRFDTVGFKKKDNSGRLMNE